MTPEESATFTREAADLVTGNVPVQRTGESATIETMLSALIYTYGDVLAEADDEGVEIPTVPLRDVVSDLIAIRYDGGAGVGDCRGCEAG